MTTTDPRPVLITAANGKTGKRVSALLESGAHSVRRASRSADVPFDWNDHSTFAPNLDGVRAAAIIYTPDLSVPGAPDAIAAFVAAAKDAGVERLVLLSGRGEPAAEVCERIVQDSGLAWTVARASWFNQNFDEGDFLPMIQGGAIALPAADIAEPFVDLDDLAQVIATALTQPGHEGQLYEITGPRAIAFDEVARIIAHASGREVSYAPITMEQFRQGLQAAGVPAAHIDMLDYVISHTLDGRNVQPQDGVQRALGRPPRDFAEYAKHAAASGVWGANTPAPAPH